MAENKEQQKHDAVTGHQEQFQPARTPKEQEESIKKAQEDREKAEKEAAAKLAPAVPPVLDEKAAKKAEEEQKRRADNKKKANKEKAELRDKLLVEAQDILAEFDGQEGNIPVSHPYWDLMNQFRSVNKEVDTEMLKEHRT